MRPLVVVAEVVPVPVPVVVVAPVPVSVVPVPAWLPVAASGAWSVTVWAPEACGGEERPASAR